LKAININNYLSFVIYSKPSWMLKIVNSFNSSKQYVVAAGGNSVLSVSYAAFAKQ